MMKKRLISIVLATILIFSVPTSVYAAEEVLGKEEVVYVNLNQDGTVDAVYVVNIVRPNNSGQISDYGDYTDVRNMTTNDTIDMNGDAITINTKAEKLFYEGTLKRSEIPWNFEIKYFLDGKEYSAQEIAGKAGALEILFNVTQNHNITSTFFDNMTLQVTFALDTDRCKHIVAENANTANVGKKKQLTYTIFPGDEKTIRINTNVTDFEMNGISINALPLKFDVEVEEDRIMDDVNEMTHAIEELNDGARKLNDAVEGMESAVGNDLLANVNKLCNGSNELKNLTALMMNGMSDINVAAQQLADGVSAMDVGIVSLNDGIIQVRQGLEALDNQTATILGGSAQVKSALLEVQSQLAGASITSQDITALTTASSNILSGINDLATALNSLRNAVSYTAYKEAIGIDSLQVGNTATIGEINHQITILSGESGNDDVIAVLNQAATMLGNNNAAIVGTETYFAHLEANVEQIFNNVVTLQTQYGQFDTEIQNLAATLGTLPDMFALLSTSINELVVQYAILDTGIYDYTGGVEEAAVGCATAANGIAELIDGSKELNDGSAKLTGGVNELLGGSQQLNEGMEAFDKAVQKLKGGIAELYEGVDDLHDGSNQLADGTSELNEETEDIDTQISDQIDEVVGEMSGNPDEIVSFVSNKNTKVNSVQFVIKTNKIEADEPVQIQPEKEEKLSFWQKALRLFGLY